MTSPAIPRLLPVKTRRPERNCPIQAWSAESGSLEIRRCMIAPVYVCMLLAPLTVSHGPWVDQSRDRVGGEIETDEHQTYQQRPAHHGIHVGIQQRVLHVEPEAGPAEYGLGQ